MTCWKYVQALALLAVTSTGIAADAARPVLAVMKFQDESGAMPLQGGVGRVLTNIIGTELAARPAFTVVERRKLPRLSAMPGQHGSVTDEELLIPWLYSRGG